MTGIYKASKDEHEEITNVWYSSVRATHHFISEEYLNYLKPLIRNEYLSNVQLFTLKDAQGVILGFIGVDEDNVEMLFIHPAAIGKGYGKKLLEFAITELRINKVDVNEQNIAAISFYEHMGFKSIGRSSVDGLGKPYPIIHMELR